MYKKSYFGDEKSRLYKFYYVDDASRIMLSVSQELYDSIEKERKSRADWRRFQNRRELS